MEGLSADGRVAGGTSSIFGGNPGFTWTAENGRNDFGLETGLPPTTAVFSVSGSGSAVAGRTYLAGGAMRAFRYVGPGTYQELGTILSYPESMARGISGDGSVVVGQVHGAGSQAFRWTPQGGMVGLGYARPWHSGSSAAAISRDGTTIVGGSGGDGSIAEPFAWRAETGMLPLPTPAGSFEAGANAVNADGTIVVGRADTTSGWRALMWREGVMIDLGTGSGFAGRPTPLALNDAGTVVVGQAPVFTSDPTAVVWTQASGWEILSDYLTRNGVPVPEGWTLRWASSVSADGLTVGGWAIPPGGGDTQGFVATIPSPGVGMTLTTILLWSVRRDRQR